MLHEYSRGDMSMKSKNREQVMRQPVRKKQKKPLKKIKNRAQKEGKSAFNEPGSLPGPC